MRMWIDEELNEEMELGYYYDEGEFEFYIMVEDEKIDIDKSFFNIIVDTNQDEISFKLSGIEFLDKDNLNSKQKLELLKFAVDNYEKLEKMMKDITGEIFLTKDRLQKELRKLQ